MAKRKISGMTVVTTLFVVVCLGVIYWLSKPAPCQWELKRQEVSPDKQHNAVVYSRVCSDGWSVRHYSEVLTLQSSAHVSVPVGNKLPSNAVLAVDDESLTRSQSPLWSNSNSVSVSVYPRSFVSRWKPTEDGVQVLIDRPKLLEPSAEDITILRGN